MRFDIVTIFPKILDSYFQESLLKKAQDKGLITIVAHNLRDFINDKHRKVDDTPYGGGPGMVMKAEPIAKAVEFLKSLPAGRQAKPKAKRKRVILFSLRGKKFDQRAAHRLAKYDQLIFICGRYEGVDERVATDVADEELAIGDFVLSGGELPAAVVIEAVARLIPGMLGKRQSLEELKGSYPVYTKPEVVKLKVKGQKSKVLKVPKVLLSGNHKKIDLWRNK
ncbi:MAG: tRNA (guanosine(37)-N1)-methyltransferase TrmD [Candidatus Harrisonbacteria bacterium RIFCSPLOWO2_02_FULL_45_10c]|uniref:tRNA (guanine-N(1)-)-methyltransferase n=1 Tax=Candidatus Harrisonbacteria bacterium RIFCSPLOWO2_02_FULL_45_10c TaxID=1798410 RepID=A0A1G1ZSF7_9BACT|nr:MAG: tRNA (guanosine(37)-N1)-methyltransferase TrmD [Candidatus Harrisonbacteria bacterium RIFCSPLOWO2_02_FULL_45_10c]